MTEDEEDEAPAVEAITDRQDTRSMIHMDLAYAEGDLGPLGHVKTFEEFVDAAKGGISHSRPGWSHYSSGQRRWIDSLTRKRYLELGHHVIEVDGNLRVAIDGPQSNNVDSMGAFPVTPTATNPDTTDKENSLTGGGSAGTTLSSSGSRHRSTGPEGARKRKIPYHACRGGATSVVPEAQQQQRHHRHFTSDSSSVR